MVEPRDYPAIEDIGAAYADPQLAELAEKVKKDTSFSGKSHEELVETLSAVSGEYATMLADFEYQETVADARMKIIRSRIILMFEDNPRAFLNNTRRRNIQICEAVYRTHPQFREALSELLLLSAKRKMIQQATYAIDQARTMLDVRTRGGRGPDGSNRPRMTNQDYNTNL